MKNYRATELTVRQTGRPSSVDGPPLSRLLRVHITTNHIPYTVVRRVLERLTLYDRAHLSYSLYGRMQQFRVGCSGYLEVGWTSIDQLRPI